MALILLKTICFLIVAPGSVAVLIPYLLLGPEAERHNLGWVHVVSVIPIAVGVGFLLWCAWDFAAAGRGTPAPIDPPRSLVVRGLYRWVRNPMYVSVTLILLGEAILFGSVTLLVYAAIVWLAFNLFVFAHEEPTLRGKFGQSYEDYCRRVSRWIPMPPRDET